MLHFSCDLCGKDLLDSNARYVVKMEVYAAHDPSEMTEDDLDVDHLEEISQLLSDEDSVPAEPAPAFKKLHYDLCPSCHRRFLANPLGRESQKFDFSAN